MLTPDSLAEALARRGRRVAGGTALPAAVLIPLLERQGEPHVLLTRRTETVRTHKGQYAFPGGMRDRQDVDAVATALREAQEEIGLEPGVVRVLGLLDDYVTITGFVVTPVVGWIPHPYPYALNPREVALVAELPLRAFLEPQPARTLVFEGLRRIVMAFDVEGHFVWGATAAMLRDLTAVVRGAR